MTGSCYMVDNDDSLFLVDCGMYQGGRQIEMRNRSDRLYRVSDVKGVFITHAHIDHSGLLPRLVRQGFRGPVYATEATCDLLKVLWLDSANIQEMEAEWQSRKNRRKGRAQIDPLYEVVDAETAATLLQPVELDQDRKPFPNVTARFVTAGHILGAASLHVTLENKAGRHRIGFSGDLGRPGQLIVPDAEVMPRVDTLFMETTYGNRLHKSLPESIEELIGVVQQAYKEGGKVIIPAFAVERTQEIIYILAKAYREGKMPKDMPIFLDSPLAISATLIFRQHPDFFDDATQEILENGQTPINLPTLKFTPKTEDSQKINEYKGPAVIIAGSGMANAGRIKHHLKHNLWRPDCHVVIVGFQAQGTTGRQIVEGAKSVKIFREDVAVKAQVHTIGGFSAHADQNELMAWLGKLVHPGLTVNLIHGEESSSLAFMELAQERFPEVKFQAPQWKEVLPLEPMPVEGEPAAAAAPTPDQLAARAAGLRERLDRIGQFLSKDGSELDLRALAAMERALEQAEKAAALQ